MDKRLLKGVWLTACIAVVLWWFYSYTANEGSTTNLKGELQIYMIIGMVFLTFPIGLLWTYLFAVVLHMLRNFGIIGPLPPLVEMGALWGGFVLFGYIQWFKLAPFLVKKFSRRGEQ
jgi:hypothetical protein